MNKFEKLFAMSDIMGMRGMLTMWFSFFTTGFAVLLSDDQQGPLRDFTMVSQLVCCTNLAAFGYSVANDVSWSKTSFYTLHFDTFATLLAFAYYGGGDLLDDSTLGVWNTVQLVGTAMNAAFGVAALYMTAGDYDGFDKYLNGVPDLVAEV
tara:strand:- start:69 stop:521 length:453 start_codon:yes stop_codon:yes gene_type:complete